MFGTETLDNLRARLLAREPLCFLQTFEERRWQQAVAALGRELERPVETWSVTQPADADADGRTDAELFWSFLARVDDAPEGTLFLIKDAHPYLNVPRVVRRLRDLCATMPARRQAILCLGPRGEIPFELSKVAVQLVLPLPSLTELLQVLPAILDDLHAEGSAFDPGPDDRERLAKAVLGLTADEAARAFRYALQGAEQVDDALFARLIGEKRQMVRGTDLLEFYELEEGAAEIGGLDGLKDWLVNRAEAFSSSAQAQGISPPKGVFLLGVQGCGKSLTARVTASLLHFPLVRLDTGALLASDRGASEKNLRDVLRLVESVAPIVLWIDEIDKAFAGFDQESGTDATMSRVVGSFLTWMEEHQSQVFVVATANSVHRLPPELLRRGRFDELFFVDLPNHDERKAILGVHLRKRGWDPEKFDLTRLADETEHFSGAEIAQIVSSALLESFSRGAALTEEDMIAQRELTVPLSTTKEDEIFALREWARTRCRPATPDSRVSQMLAEESRKGLLKTSGPSEEMLARWRQLAERGQINAAVIEYVRPRTAVGFSRLQEEFQDLFDTRGEIGLALRSDPNVVLWSGLSAELSELLVNLIKAKRLFLHPAPPGFYASEELGFTLPSVSGLDEKKLPRPGWYPVTLQVSPPAGGGDRLMNVARIKLNKSH